jgi:peptidoglycan/LPS O-acetylase OafA/YrhL
MEYWGLYTTHFWSLAVEEQFYLLWPWIILFLNRKYLVHAIGGFIVVGMFTQVVHGRNEYGLLPTYTCFDSLARRIIVMGDDHEPRCIGKVLQVLSLTALLVAGLVLAQAFYGNPGFSSAAYPAFDYCVMGDQFYRDPGQKNKKVPRRLSELPATRFCRQDQLWPVPVPFMPFRISLQSG